MVRDLLSGPRALVLFAALAAATPACGSETEGRDGKSDEPTAPPGRPGDAPGPASEGQSPPPSFDELPWEIVSSKGESLLPDVFYAEAVQNEQIMPYSVRGRTLIDRLVYPTIGNPNLYTRGDDTDELDVVTRVEESLFAHLSPEYAEVPGTPLRTLSLTSTPQNGLTVLLVSRDARAAATTATSAVSSGEGTGVYRVVPTKILVSPEPDDLPEAFKKRKTLRFVFDREAMANVPAGLYDLRFEPRKDAALVRVGSAPVYEFQYNAVRVFDDAPDEYKVLNVTDTQVSVGSSYKEKTLDRLAQLVSYLNVSRDADVQKAAFVTFNGDLHNGGSPGTLRQRKVAMTYNDEAVVIVDQLKALNVPIFLVAGNHDGYANIGHVPPGVPALDAPFNDDLQKAVADINPPWPSFSWSAYQSFVQRTADQKEGLHVDLYGGSFQRLPFAKTYTDGWREVPRAERNWILYDGFYQWQKTYGPLYASVKFGKNVYINANTYDLRQHRRTGWGMYTVNYGGNVSPVQFEWIRREAYRAEKDGLDAVLLTHHDPRGGHKGNDHGYFFDNLAYKGMSQSAVNYVDKYFFDRACKLPDWAQSNDLGQDCLHDGLQEWMRPDTELDCSVADRRDDGTCNPDEFSPGKGDQAKRYWFSAFSMLELLAKQPALRTMLVGHTHYNELEVATVGSELVPNKLTGDTGALARFESWEATNPVRSADGTIPEEVIKTKNDLFFALYQHAAQRYARTLDGPPGRELALLHLTSASDLASQTQNGASVFGFSILHVSRREDARNYALPQINDVTFYKNDVSTFRNLGSVSIERIAALASRGPSNPIDAMFDW